MVQYCPNCENEIDENDMFCKYCGKLLKTVPDDEIMKKKTEEHETLLNDLDKTGICGKLTKPFKIFGLEECDIITDLNTGKSRRDYLRSTKKPREIDAIGKPESGDITYIIEAEQKLKNNKAYEAIGQVFFYEFIYKEYLRCHGYNQENTRKVIVCKEVSDAAVRHFCRVNDIDVIEITDKGIKKNT